MEEKRTSVFENGLIWFGAAVSIAEILTGTYFAPLGFGKGLLAILLGHVIGCVMLYLAGLIGGKVRKSAMDTAKMSFGSKGALLFCILNIRCERINLFFQSSDSFFQLIDRSACVNTQLALYICQFFFQTLSFLVNFCLYTKDNVIPLVCVKKASKDFFLLL